jgi:F-type H+-transporting ATPase subunit a
MHEQSVVGAFLNGVFFDPLAGLLGFQLAEGHHAVPDHIVMILVIACGLIGFSLWLRRRLSVDNPGRVQHLVEVILEAVQQLMSEVIGKGAGRYLPLIGALGTYILCGNLLGLVPGFISPTSNLNVTASCAVCSFLYYNYQGIRKYGLWKYLKHFAGPVWWLAWLMFPVEIVSHFARIISLSLRLFGNIFAEELIINSLNQYIFPFLASIPVMFLALFASTIQAFIFILLSMVYISGAVEDSHEEGRGGKHHEVTTHPQAKVATA